MNSVPQFGDPLVDYKERPGAYAVIKNDLGQLLVVSVNGRYHLPGGGIDAGEDPQLAVEREILEETGYKVEGLQAIGQANQYLVTKDLGPLNKLGRYFAGRVSSSPPVTTSEADHEVRWISPAEFLASTAHDFHKWAVEKEIVN